MKILHIIKDDKFYNSIIYVFDKTFCKNEYVCIVDQGDRFRYIKSDRIKLIYKEDCSFLWERNDIDVYMFHPLYGWTYDWVLAIPKDKIVIASSFGADLYYSQNKCKPLIPINLYKEKTKLFFTPKKQLYKRLKYFISRVYHHKYYAEEKRKEGEIVMMNQKRQLDVINRIDYWATVLPVEFELLKTICSIRASYFPFHYSSHFSSQLKGIDGEMFDFSSAAYILLGNSADPSNNHIDLLRLMKKRKITNSYLLYVPLAYGNNEYKEYLIEYLKENAIDPIIQENMIDSVQYKNNLKRCRIAVFGHMRQQSIGNVNINLRQGKKVFLYKDSIVYKYYRSIGIKIFNIEEDLFLREINTPLGYGDVLSNRRILEEEFAVDSFLPKIELILSGVESRLERMPK